jgi:glucose-6-phosphate isomerase
MDAATRWERFKRMSFHHEELGVSLDLSCLSASPEALAALSEPMAKAFEEMHALEGGAIANPDEGRMVGHYWLRAPALAPSEEIRQGIEEVRERVERFASEVFRAVVKPERSERFRRVLHVGIGGSALGPQLVCDALGGDGVPVDFVDNTDPDGIERRLAALGDELGATLTVIVSKSGGTKETQNGMLEVARAYQARGLSFGAHAVAVTGEGSQLDGVAEDQGFIARFPMWDWVGGRTSVLSVVGLLPAALSGVNLPALLEGARRMDDASRVPLLSDNPAALLAAAWHLSSGGRGKKSMVVIPYKDALQLLARYLQQLVMESLGKRLDRGGRVVHQGLTVYGNKGSTDQHAYVQQLLDGPDDFFVTLLEVLRDRHGVDAPLEVEPGVTSGDYLSGFLHGTRRALTERGRASILLTLERLDARALGAVIALYERAVGLYASLIDVNAYHQPAVESGKRAAAEVIELSGRVRALLGERRGERFDAEQAAAAIGSDDREAMLRVLLHLAANPYTGVLRERAPEAEPWEATFSLL